VFFFYLRHTASVQVLVVTYFRPLSESSCGRRTLRIWEGRLPCYGVLGCDNV